MKVFTGIPVSKGIVLGKALLYTEDDLLEVPRFRIQAEQTDYEWKRFLNAVAEAMADIKALQETKSSLLNGNQAGIFEAHLMMLEDPEFHDSIKKQLTANLQNIEWVVWEVSHEIAQKMMASPISYFRERAVDIADMSHRLLNILLSIKKISLADLTRDVIIVTRDILPSDILAMNKERVKAIVMDAGSQTSHTAILTRAFEIPAVLGLSSITKEITNGETLLVNGETGEVIVAPDRQSIAKYKQTVSRFCKDATEAALLRELPAETLDGHRVAINANIEVPEEAEQALRYGADGIGLYRSEFLFLNPGLPAEKEVQYHAYHQVLKVMGIKPVTIRTVDVGGDKVLPELRSLEEKNPLLGWRAIRFSLAHPEILKTQFRAILQASVCGNARIMFPMISGIEELEQALALFEETKDECRARGEPFADYIAVGSMIEIPAAAETADILAKKSAFFSLGTNDLIQYTLAVDRGNERVSYLARPFHPAVIRFIKKTIDAAHQAGIKAAMCGEFAGNPGATALLLGLGLDEFSMTASAIPQIKKVIRNATLESCRALAEKVCACTSARETEALLKHNE
jgi:phosphotransferase system enzyme I (PtsI)